MIAQISLWLVLMAMQSGNAQHDPRWLTMGWCEEPRVGMCVTRDENRNCYINIECYPAAEPQDVPAVSRTRRVRNPRDESLCELEAAHPELPKRCDGKTYVTETKWTCADKSRVLMTAENGEKWCHRVQTEGSK